MPGPISVTLASLRFKAALSGPARISGSASAATRNSAPWPPIAASCKGEKIRSMSASERPETSATAPPVKSSSRAKVRRSPGGTQTCCGDGARSRMVPSMSSRMAHFRKSGTSEISASSMSRSEISRLMSKSASTSDIRDSFDKRKRPAHRFERLALGGDAPAGFDQRGRGHQNRADHIAHGDAQARAGTDQHAEQQWAGDAADAGADGIEEGDGEGANLQRENLAHRQIRRACRRRGEEEYGHPGDGQRGRGEQVLAEQISGDGKQNAGERIGRRDHDLAADGIEQAAEQERPEHVTRGERQDVPADCIC